MNTWFRVSVLFRARRHPLNHPSISWRIWCTPTSLRIPHACKHHIRLPKVSDREPLVSTASRAAEGNDPTTFCRISEWCVDAHPALAMPLYDHKPVTVPTTEFMPLILNGSSRRPSICSTGPRWRGGTAVGSGEWTGSDQEDQWVGVVAVGMGSGEGTGSDQEDQWVGVVAVGMDSGEWTGSDQEDQWVGVVAVGMDSGERTGSDQGPTFIFCPIMVFKKKTLSDHFLFFAKSWLKVCTYSPKCQNLLFWFFDIMTFDDLKVAGICIVTHHSEW